MLVAVNGVAAGLVAVVRPQSPASAAILRPDHVVVLIEEDRFCNAIGDTTNMPYVNQLAQTSLVYKNVQCLNTPSQQGEMNYLGLYSGSTQGVTDDGPGYTFSGNNLAASLNNTPGMSFAGYCEALPSDGSQVTEAANTTLDPANHPDLYVRNYNPMAMFTNAGTGITNAMVNKTFAEFPSAANFASLPTVSFVVPDTLDSTHGSNEAPPFATDPSAYVGLRQSADSWLQAHIDSYVQWAKTHNSLLIITGDELDRAHPSSGINTIVTGAPSLFVAGTNTTTYNHYDTLRTIEDMYGLTPLGNSVSVSAFATNAAGQLIGDVTVLHWDGTTNAFTSAHWLNASNAGPFAPAVGNVLTLGVGTATFSPTATGQFLTLSASGANGQELDVTGGTLSITVGGPTGSGYGLLLDQSGVLNLSSGSVSIAGPLSIGQTAGNTASATFSGGSIAVGVAAGTDRTLYVGNAGTGSVVESGSATITAPTLTIAANAGSFGSYSLTGGTLTATTINLNTGGTFAWTAGSLSAGSITQSGGSFSATPAFTIASTAGNAGSYSLAGGSLTAGAINLNTGGTLAWTGGTLAATSITQSGGSFTAGATLNIAVVGGGNVGTYILSGGSLTAGAVNINNQGVLSWTGGSLSTTSITQTGGTFTATQTFNVAGTGGNTGSYSLGAGTFKVPTLNVATGGSVSWTGGTLTPTSITQSGGSVSFTPSYTLAASGANSTSYALSGGTLTSAGLVITAGGSFSWTGGTINATTMRETGGAVTMTPALTLGSTGANAASYTLSGGTLNAGAINVNTGGSLAWTGGTLTSTSITETGGSVTASPTFSIGTTASNTGSYSLSGGNFAIANALNVKNGGSFVWTGGTLGAGSITQSGGSAAISPTLVLATSTGTAGSYALQGGALSAGPILVNTGGTFAWSGGTLTAGAISQSGGVVSATPALAIAATGGNAPSYSLQGGSLTTTSLNVNSGGNFTWSAGSLTATSITQNGGSFAATPALTLATTGGNGTSYALHGGSLGTSTVNVNDGGNVSLDGTGSFNASTLVVGASGATGAFTQSGGSATITSLTLGSAAGATGAYSLTNGVLNTGTATVGDAGNGTFTQSGGTHTVSTSLTLGNQAGCNGIYNLNGGILASPLIADGAGTSTMNFNGGTLRATASNPTFLHDLNNAAVLAGGAIVDTNGQDITIAQALSSGVSGDGGLTKNGAGSLTLGGTNTFNGPTTVNAGGLTLAGGASLASANVTVALGSTMSIAGSLSSNVIVNANGTTVFAGNTGSSALNASIAGLNVGAGVTASIGESSHAGLPVVLTAPTLTFAGGGALDITNNELVTHATVQQVQSMLSMGQVFTSETIVGDILGYNELGNGSVAVRFTLMGDTNLDGTVNVSDLANLAANFGQSGGALWIDGDSSGDGIVNIADLADLAGNFGQSLAVSGSTAAAAEPAGAAVPEPLGASLLLAPLLTATLRRRRPEKSLSHPRASG
jgi:hypothetical protein